ncbi:MAG: hypothetical protein AAF481_19030 [Acidobacteriota bacterium]
MFELPVLACVLAAACCLWASRVRGDGGPALGWSGAALFALTVVGFILGYGWEVGLGWFVILLTLVAIGTTALVSWRPTFASWASAALLGGAAILWLL